MSDQPKSPVSHALRKLWGTTLPRRSSSYAVAFTPSGERVAAGSIGVVDGHPVGSLTLIDASTGHVLRQIVDDWQVYGLAFSPDNRWLATSEGRHGSPGARRIRILDVDTFAERCSYSGQLINPPTSLRFSHDGTWVAAQMNYPTLTCVFDATNGTERWRREPGYDISPTLVLSPDSGAIAVGDWQFGIAVLDALTGSERLNIRTRNLGPFAYSPDNRTIVAGYSDGTICVFDARSGERIWSVRVIPQDYDGQVVSMAVSDDAKWVSTMCWVRVPNFPAGIGILGVYDLAQGTPRFPPVRFESAGNVLYSPTLRHVVVACAYASPNPPVYGYGLAVLDACTGLEDSNSKSDIRQCAVAPDGGSIIVRNEPFIEMWDLGIEVSRFAVDTSLTSIEMSPRGTPLVAVADTSAAVTVIAAESGVRWARQPIPGGVASMVFADRGQAVA